MQRDLGPESPLQSDRSAYEGRSATAAREEQATAYIRPRVVSHRAVCSCGGRAPARGRGEAEAGDGVASQDLPLQPEMWRARSRVTGREVRDTREAWLAVRGS